MEGSAGTLPLDSVHFVSILKFVMGRRCVALLFPPFLLRARSLSEKSSQTRGKAAITIIYRKMSHYEGPFKCDTYHDTRCRARTNGAHSAHVYLPTIEAIIRQSEIGKRTS